MGPRAAIQLVLPSLGLWNWSFGGTMYICPSRKGLASMAFRESAVGAMTKDSGMAVLYGIRGFVTIGTVDDKAPNRHQDLRCTNADLSSKEDVETKTVIYLHD